MAKKAAVQQKKGADLNQFNELVKELPRRVIELRDKCEDDGAKTSTWFRSLGKIAIDLKTALPKEHSEIAKALESLSGKAKNVVSARPAELSRPIQHAWKALTAASGQNVKAAESIFDELRKLMYPESSETQRSGSTTKVTVQEFDRGIINLDEDAVAEVTELIKAIKDTNPVELDRIVNTDCRYLIAYLYHDGYGLRELARILDLPQATLSRVARGDSEPSESFSTKIKNFVFFNRSH